MRDQSLLPVCRVLALAAQLPSYTDPQERGSGSGSALRHPHRDSGEHTCIYICASINRPLVYRGWSASDSYTRRSFELRPLCTAGTWGPPRAVAHTLGSVDGNAMTGSFTTANRELGPGNWSFRDPTGSSKKVWTNFLKFCCGLSMMRYIGSW